MYDGFSREAIAVFKSVVRLRRGREIAAACGQLAAARA
jgi:adenine C2-methylase RlmN of 23S rRNA A2503 and tRNA A37